MKLEKVTELRCFNISAMHAFILALFFRVVADVVGDLKMMAMDMGSELERQNAQLDRINVKVCCLNKSSQLFVGRI